MPTYLDFLYEKEVNEDTLAQLYHFSPFLPKNRHYAGKIVHTGLLDISSIITSKAHGGYTSEQWLEYKSVLFGAMCNLILLHGTHSFSSKESSLSLYKITNMLMTDLLKYKLPGEVINLLLSRLHEIRNDANTIDLANALFTIPKLLELGQLDEINSNLVIDLFTTLFTKRAKANPQDISSSLWAMAKLAEGGYLEELNSTHVNGLLARLHSLGKDTFIEMRSVHNSLWSIAKLVETGYLKGVIPSDVNFLLNKVIVEKATAAVFVRDLAYALWSVGKMVEARVLEINPLYLNKLLSLLDKHSRYASEHDITCTLRALARLAEIRQMNEIDADKVLVSLLHQLHKERASISIRGCANGIWSIAKLIELGHLGGAIGSEVLSSLLRQCHAQRMTINAQDTANYLWSVAKLAEIGFLTIIDAKKANDILARLYSLRTHPKTKPIHLCNGLWSIAKLIELGHLSTTNALYIQGLLAELCVQKMRLLGQEVTLSVWASGVINTVIPITVPEELTDLAFHRAEGASLTHKNQTIMGLTLLGVQDHYDLTFLIDACRPISDLKRQQIIQYSKGAISVEKEAFIAGFFVDLLVIYPGERKRIIEFDGSFHTHPRRRAFDAFRDKILLAMGYEIERVNIMAHHKSSLFEPPKREAASKAKAAPAAGRDPAAEPMKPALKAAEKKEKSQSTLDEIKIVLFHERTQFFSSRVASKEKSDSEVLTVSDDTLKFR